MHSSSSDTKTTEIQSFANLLKGNVGPGCLSLPWAMSQIGVVNGIIATTILAIWTGYNSWGVITLKRYISTLKEYEGITANNDNNDNEQAAAAAEEETVATSATTDTGSTTTITTDLTYSDLGTWAYGTRFGAVITACICVQQMAVCTVFFSFVGENLKEVLYTMVGMESISHVVVVSMSVPFIVLLVVGFPHLKALAPVMMIATLTLFIGFGLLGSIIVQQWQDRPTDESNNSSSFPLLALCAILYSFEGICLVVPVESSMKRPKNFFKVFVSAMICVVIIYCTLAGICVITFGSIDNGSITAYLLSRKDELEPNTYLWIILSNTVVSISVLLTYPLQLFPCLELMGPTFGTHLNNNSMMNCLFGRRQRSSSSSSEQQQEGEGDGVFLQDQQNQQQDDTLSITLTEEQQQSFSSWFVPMEQKSRISGDSVFLRLFLVAITFLIAVIVPNVQILISLAGALAGSSIALLIPPILELAYLRHCYNNENENNKCCNALKLHIGRCYISIFLGITFLSIGTIAALKDIFNSYK